VGRIAWDGLRAGLEAARVLKYGAPTTWGGGARRRASLGYFTPDEVYEALVGQFVRAGTAWVDVGGGRDVFPHNPRLARLLAGRCGRLVGVDPSDTIEENPFVHERVRCPVEEYRSSEPFDLATLRMVAEHIERPEPAVASLARLVRPGGLVVVYTINLWAPVPVLTALVPFRFHHRLKKLLWNTEEKDTFPVSYKMNTRRRLEALFRAGGFTERAFLYLDDCRTFHRFAPLHFLELSLWKVLNTLGVHYPETCLLGVYQRLPQPSAA
jgi:SAM-dependent methyltransferase